jgi:hypothetical protein
MQVYHNPFPINTLELNNPKVLIWPDQAEKAKVKHVIVGEQRPEIKVQDKLLEDILKVAAKASMLGGGGGRQDEEDWQHVDLSYRCPRPV